MLPARSEWSYIWVETASNVGTRLTLELLPASRHPSLENMFALRRRRPPVRQMNKYIPLLVNHRQNPHHAKHQQSQASRSVMALQTSSYALRGKSSTCVGEHPPQGLAAYPK